MARKRHVIGLGAPEWTKQERTALKGQKAAKDFIFFVDIKQIAIAQSVVNIKI